MGIRLINANKLQTTTTYFGISDTPVEVVKKSVIDNAKTVEAVPLSVIEDIKAGIDNEHHINVQTETAESFNDGLDKALEIIDRKVKEIEHDR